MQHAHAAGDLLCCLPAAAPLAPAAKDDAKAPASSAAAIQNASLAAALRASSAACLACAITSVTRFSAAACESPVRAATIWARYVWSLLVIAPPGVTARARMRPASAVAVARSAGARALGERESASR